MPQDGFDTIVWPGNGEPYFWRAPASVFTESAGRGKRR